MFMALLPGLGSIHIGFRRAIYSRGCTMSSSSTPKINGPQSRKANGQKKPSGYKSKPRSQQNGQRRKSDSGDHEVEWKRNEKLEKNEDDESVEDDSQTCIVCANPIKIASLSPCHHRICHMCAFRTRSLYNKKECLLCRTECERLIFTDNLSKEDYNDVSDNEKVVRDEKFKIDFTSASAKKETLKLLKHICPVKSCKEQEFSNFKELNAHCIKFHEKQFCSLCAHFKKAFISELDLYTNSELRAHETVGDRQGGFKGHPACKFCNKNRFYSDDELRVHMRDRHEKCFVCEQINPSNINYFRDYDNLFRHFKDDHFICTVSSCLEQKFVVFADELDLQAHMIQMHGDIYGGSRNLMSHSFGGQLSTFRSSSLSSPQSISSNDNNNAEDTDSPTVKKMRLEERARHYLNYSQPEFNRFQGVNNQYLGGKIDAEEVKAQYEEIFKGGHADIMLLLYELSEICPSGSLKQKNLVAITTLEATKEKIKSNFPSLPGTDSVAAVSLHGWGSNKPASKVYSTSSVKFPSLSSASSTGSSTSSYNFNYANPSSKPKTSTPTGPRITSFPALPGESKTLRIVPGSQLKSTVKAKAPVKSFNSLVSNASSSTSLKSSSSSPSSSATSISKKQSDPADVVLPRYLDNLPKKGKNNSKEPSPVPVDNPLFPTLPSHPVKVKPPRVNPVNISMGKWGTSNSATSSTSSFPSLGGLDEALPGTSTSASESGKGKKKKSKQVLFHIGM